MRSELYVPIDVVEALGRSTIARHQLGLALDVLVSSVDSHLGRLAQPKVRESLVGTSAYLKSIADSGDLNVEWSGTLAFIARKAIELDQHYFNAGRGILYSRGAGDLEGVLRDLSDQLNVPGPQLGMTLLKTQSLATDFSELARSATDLSVAILTSGESRERRL